MIWKDAVKYAKEHGATITDDGKIIIGDKENPSIIRQLSENDEYMLVDITPDGKYVMTYPCEYIKELMNPIQKCKYIKELINSVQKIDPNDIQAIDFDYISVDWQMFKDYALSIGAELLDKNMVKYTVKYDELETRSYTFDRNGDVYYGSSNIAKYRTPTQMRDILKGLFEKGE